MKKDVGTAHAIFDHSHSLEELREVVGRINNNPNVPQKQDMKYFIKIPLDLN